MRKVILFAPVLFLLSCGGSEESDEKLDYVETKYDKEIATYLEDKEWKPTREKSGLYIYTEVEGEGMKPGLEDFLTLKYEGRLLDGTVFDGSGENAISFPVPVKQLIAGWKEGIPHFGKGGKGTLILPPELGYGAEANGPIPGNSVTVFDIEIVDFSPTPPVPPMPELDRSVDYSTEIDEYIKSKKLTGFEKTETGLYVKVEHGGSDEKPTNLSYLTLNYEGYLTNGSKFDGTGGTPTTFPFPLGRTIPGWQEGIPYFGKGGSGTLIIPPYMGYGPNDQYDQEGNINIPGKSILVFDFEILDFTDTPPSQN